MIEPVGVAAGDIGLTTDPEATGNGSVIAILKRQRTILGTIVVLLGAGLPALLVAGRLDTNIGAWLGATTPTVGQKTMAASLPVTVASDQDATAGVPIRSTVLSVTQAPAANTGATVTLPAVAGSFHYITAINIQRNATAALAGTATLAITTTNLPGAPQFRVGNAMAAGGTQTDVALTFTSPLKSTTVNTATTVVLPAPGAAVLWTATVWYYTAP